MTFPAVCLTLEAAAATCCTVAAVGLARDNVGGAALFGVAGLAMAVGGVAVAVRGMW